MGPGDPGASRLYRKAARLEKPSMPTQGDPLSEAEVALIKRWIEMGAPWPADPHSVNDMHAAILHAFGLDHTQLTFLHNGGLIGRPTFPEQ
jgi:hypothetical protein